MTPEHPSNEKGNLGKTFPNVPNNVPENQNIGAEKSSHTEALWERNGRQIVCRPIAGSGVKVVIAKVAGDNEESEANAALIAAAPNMAYALDRIFSYVSYVNIHGVGAQPEPREDGQPQPMRVPPEEFARIFQEIGTLASFALMKAGR